MSNKIEIHYCPQCGWLVRSAWLAQELLGTFQEELQELALKPAGKGEFRIVLNHQQIWSREEDGGFPEITALKRSVRDVVAPGRDLGHIDKKTKTKH